MGGNYKVREVAKPKTYKPKTLEPQETPLPQADEKTALKDRIKEMQSVAQTRAASASLPPKNPSNSPKRQENTILVGYAREDVLSNPSDVSREVLLYLNYAKETDKDKNTAIAWNESGYKLRVVDYDAVKAEKVKEQLLSKGQSVYLPSAGQKTAVVTEYDFDIHGLHCAGTGVMWLENIDMQSRHTQKDVVSPDKINSGVKNPEKIECSLNSAQYTDAYDLYGTKKTHNVFALSIKGPHSSQSRNYAITPYNSLNYAYPPKQTFMGISEPINISAYVKRFKNNVK